MSPRKHEQVVIEVDGRSAEVDVELAPLIDALWRLGIDTQYSCAGVTHPTTGEVDWAQILFPDVADLRSFLDLFGLTELSTARFHISKRAASDPIVRWMTRILVEPAGSYGTDVFGPTDDARANDHVQMRAEVRFPSSHIPLMTTIVTDRANEAVRSSEEDEQERDRQEDQQQQREHDDHGDQPDDGDDDQRHQPESETAPSEGITTIRHDPPSFDRHRGRRTTTS